MGQRRYLLGAAEAERSRLVKSSSALSRSWSRSSPPSAAAGAAELELELEEAIVRAATGRDVVEELPLRIWAARRGGGRRVVIGVGNLG